MMAAAGTAVHLGSRGARVSISQQAVDRTEAMGADGSESRITLALALCQVGRADEALAISTVIDVRDAVCCGRSSARPCADGRREPDRSTDAERVARDAGSSTSTG
jgi:hypothetical protein